MKVAVGRMIRVKPSHHADLKGDPPQGMVVQVFSTRKVRVFWCNGQFSSHDLESPHMWRYEIQS